MKWHDYKMPSSSGSYLLNNGRMIAHITRMWGGPLIFILKTPSGEIVRFHPAAVCADLRQARAAIERRVALLYPGAFSQTELEV